MSAIYLISYLLYHLNYPGSICMLTTSCVQLAYQGKYIHTNPYGIDTLTPTDTHLSPKRPTKSAIGLSTETTSFTISASRKNTPSYL